ncbi:MAG: CopD family protein [Alphaproteobacteria bacterium]|nr:CopD family protein [Alphaproteobacteria bacterium]
MLLSSVAIAIHAIAAMVWVGGMFFAYTVLRPSLGAFEPQHRLMLWRDVFSRFFVWVWIAVIALPLSGYVLVFFYFDGFGSAGMHIHIMHLLGLVMIGLFLLLYFGPYPGFRDGVAAKDWPRAAKHLNSIRRIVGINTIIGLVTVVVGASGRLWS